MAKGGSIEFDVKINGYWQTCPICTGCGTVPADFYARLGVGTSTARERCRRCSGTGTIAVPIASESRRKQASS
jgi:DnaJ-class molecular chaperone